MGQMFRASLFAVSLAGLSVVALTAQPEGHSVDFPSFYSAAGTLARGENPYEVLALQAYAQERGIDSEVYPYLYPPFLASVLRPVTLLSPETADRMWGTLMVVMFALSVVLVTLLPQEDRPGRGPSHGGGMLQKSALAAGILMLLPLGENLLTGQVNAIVLACITVAILGMEREGRGWEWGSGAALAVAALIKVTPALLVLLFLARRKTSALWAFAFSVLAGLGLSMLISGVDVWGEFLAFLPQLSYGRSIDGLFHPISVMNLSLSGFIMRVAEGSGPAVRLIAMTAALLILALILRAVFRRPVAPGRGGLVLALLVVMVVLSPYAWIHHMVFLFPGAFMMLHEMTGRARENEAQWLLPLSWLLLAGATVNFPGLYPSMEIPENLWRFFTSVNLFLLLAILAIALRWSSPRLPLVHRHARLLGDHPETWPNLAPAPVRET